MPKMLRHKETGEIWPYNGDLARHEDVEIFDNPDPQFQQAIAADKTVGDLEAKPATKKKAPVKKKSAPKPKSEPEAAQPDVAGEAELPDDVLDGLSLDDD